MNSKKLLITVILLFTVIPLVSFQDCNAAPTYSFIQPQEIDKGAPLFFLFTLNDSESVHIQIESQSSCNYSILLFNSRPNEPHINPDGSLDTSVFSSSSLKSDNTSVNPHLNFTAPVLSSPKLYYIEIILLNASSDLFYIYSTKSLSRYYIPQIPSFPIALTVGITFGCIILLIFLKRREITFRSN
ncbi:MAG: hypothetical protein EU541_03385 [Promethearchaeota archaeon]|nr:MAG: hypothetical protein EU541_03385 [Candidatus Lokiarchaeota archaeon]